MNTNKFTSEKELRYLRALAEKYPNTAFAASEIIRIEALLRLPKGTEHFMSDLHGENEAFVHIIKTQHNCVSDRTAYSGKFIPIVHEYLLLLRKDEPMQYPLLMTYRMEGDIRDMPSATWRDILADAMESFQNAVHLEEIYIQVGHHQRAKHQYISHPPDLCRRYPAF